MPMVAIKGYRCLRCNHTWVPRGWEQKSKEIPPDPKVCPRCKSAWWNEPRKDK